MREKLSARPDLTDNLQIRMKGRKKKGTSDTAGALGNGVLLGVSFTSGLK